MVVNVDRVLYVSGLETPSGKPHAFAYFISIRNEGVKTVKILARKWIVTESCGEVVVVEGDGVVGQKPLLAPGEEFSYNSYHVVASDAEVEGGFFGCDDAGKLFVAPIPKFKLRVPS